MIYLKHTCVVCDQGRLAAFKQQKTNLFFWCCEECESCWRFAQNTSVKREATLSFAIEESGFLKPCETVQEIEIQGIPLEQVQQLPP